MEGDEMHAAIDIISRRHKLLFKIKIDKIDPVIEAGELYHFFF